MRDSGFVIADWYGNKRGRFLCYAALVTDGRVNLGQAPLDDLSSNDRYESVRQAVVERGELPPKLKGKDLAAIQRAFERWEEKGE